jgi:hypothetical protein
MTLFHIHTPNTTCNCSNVLMADFLPTFISLYFTGLKSYAGHTIQLMFEEVKDRFVRYNYFYVLEYKDGCLNTHRNAE